MLEMLHLYTSCNIKAKNSHNNIKPKHKPCPNHLDYWWVFPIFQSIYNAIFVMRVAEAFLNYHILPCANHIGAIILHILLTQITPKVDPQYRLAKRVSSKREACGFVGVAYMPLYARTHSAEPTASIANVATRCCFSF